MTSLKITVEDVNDNVSIATFSIFISCFFQAPEFGQSHYEFILPSSKTNSTENSAIAVGHVHAIDHDNGVISFVTYQFSEETDELWHAFFSVDPLKGTILIETDALQRLKKILKLMNDTQCLELYVIAWDNGFPQQWSLKSSTVTIRLRPPLALLMNNLTDSGIKKNSIEYFFDFGDYYESVEVIAFK